MIPENRGERGQLLIVGAVAIAILLVALALALNTALSAGVHAPTATEPTLEERELLRYYDEVHRAMAGTLPVEPVNGSDYPEIEAEVRSELAQWDRLTSPLLAEQGLSSSQEVETIYFRSHIVQDEPGEVRPHNGATAWQVADTTEIHTFEMDLFTEDLVRAENCSASPSCFGVIVTAESGEQWVLEAARSNDSSTMRVTVTPATGQAETLQTTDEEVSLNLSAGTFTDSNGTQSFTGIAEDLGDQTPASIDVDNGQHATGTYLIVVDGKVAASIAADTRYSINDSPRVDPAVEATDIRVNLTSPTLVHEVTIQVIPGDEDE